MLSPKDGFLAKALPVLLGSDSEVGIVERLFENVEKKKSTKILGKIGLRITSMILALLLLYAHYKEHVYLT